ncbi:condensation domain-containing protein [Streptomyces sp. NBC_00503]|uniref:condensation domain-containing protein n=1 Tax=Streptomyces sp. NBC_00503 TaxID=2903659 RepID=UPI002E80D8CA|nr:condensation domain-containing protein [Streptomyces sp. NBC_00503]WUD84121.1 condensation domain-containing protein [Streptomyces sp. NBC_00503]
MSSQAAPLSTIQERLWFLWQLDPSATHYNISFGWRCVGRDAHAVEHAVRAVLARHEVLRGAYRTDATGIPNRFTLPADQVPLRTVTLPDGAAAEGAVDALIAATHAEPFDLGASSARIVLATEPTGASHVLWTCHHIAVDAWSIQLIRDDLAALLGPHPHELPAPPATYAEFARWESSVHRDPGAPSAIARRARIAVAGPATTPWGKPQTPDVYGAPAGEVHTTVEGQDFINLTARASAEGITLYGLGLAACAIALSEWCATDEVVVGANIAKRHLPGLDSVVGMFVDPVVLRLPIDRYGTLRDAVERVWDGFLDVVEDSDAPHLDVVRAAARMRADRHGPLFDVIVTSSEEEQSRQLPGIAMEPTPAPSPTAVKFGLSVEFIVSPERLRIHLIHPDTGCEAPAVARFADRVCSLLRAMAAMGPDTPVPHPPPSTRTGGRFAVLVDEPVSRATVPTEGITP